MRFYNQPHRFYLRRRSARQMPGGPLSAELICVKRHRFPDAHSRAAGHPLHSVRQPMVPTRPLQLGHSHQMPGQVPGSPSLFSSRSHSSGATS